MIDPAFVRLMARYNSWQNKSLFGAADTVSEELRRQDRGAFFGSIHATLCHLLWADHVWMNRFDGWDAPRVGLADSASWVADWSELKSKRRITDARMTRWANGTGFAGPRR